MAVNDIYQAVVRSNNASSFFTNVFWYRCIQSLGGVPAAILADLIESELIPAITPLQTTNCVYTDVTVVNYGDPVDSAVEALTNTGEIAGGTEAGFVAFQFRFPRPYPGRRAGFKRFACPPDADVVGNTWTKWDSADADTLESVLASILTDGVDYSFEPVIVVHQKKSDPLYKIELGTNPEVSFAVTEAVALQVITSQSSRKRPNTN